MTIDSYIAALAGDHAFRWFWSTELPHRDQSPRRAEVRGRRDVRVRFKKFV